MRKWRVTSKNDTTEGGAPCALLCRRNIVQSWIPRDRRTCRIRKAFAGHLHGGEWRAKSLVCEEGEKLAEGLAAVAELIFFGDGKFGKGFRARREEENGIVAEAGGAARCTARHR